MQKTIKVLWFSPNGGVQRKNKKSSVTWVESLQRVVNSIDGIKLGICYQDDGNNITYYEDDNVSYYPISLKRNYFQKKIDQFTIKYSDKLLISRCIDVINLFSPDIVHIFGSEWCYGDLYGKIDVPIVIHMQGCRPAIQIVSRRLHFSPLDLIKEKWYSPLFVIGTILRNHRTEKECEREVHIISNNIYFMGRTRWDKALVSLFSHKASYFYCSEALRTDFVNCQQKWEPKNRKKYIIVTTGTPSFIKGYDFIVHTVNILNKFYNIDFEWRLLGCTKQRLDNMSRKEKISYSNMNIIPLGALSADQIIKELLDCDIYVHASYIDNSPNSVCEAQYLGVPVISTYVGGIPSLFADDYDMSMLVGILDPYYLSSKIYNLLTNKQLQKELGDSNYKIAKLRHADDSIAKSLMNIYTTIISRDINE